MNKKQTSLLLIFAIVVGSFFFFDLGSYLNLAFFQDQRDALVSYQENNFFLSALVYFLLYVFLTAFSLPAATLVTVIGGAIFGFWWGLLLISFASTIGASLAFLMARTILHDWVQQKYGHRLKPINAGIKKDGIFYLFTLRLIPVFPFFLVNVLMALTPIRLRDFYWVSQLGMLFGTALYVEVGVQLGMAESLPAVFSLGMLRIVILLAIFPWLSKWFIAWLKRRKIYKNFPRPKSYDANLVVIGAGSAGLVTSYIAALTKARVILIEKSEMGGDCLNTGCVPSKALIRRAGVNHLLSRADEFGLQSSRAKVDFAKVMQGVRDSIAAIAPHDSVERYTKLGVECIQGEAEILSPFLVKVGDKEISTRHIVIATGARPNVPDTPGLDQIEYVTSDTVWNLSKLPERFLVLGAGPIGCELAQAFSRLGSRVTVADKGIRPVAMEDVDVSDFVHEQFSREGISFLGKHEVIGFEKNASENVAVFKTEQGEARTVFDVVLVALGRKPNTEGFGLEELNVEKNPQGAIKVNQYLQTNYPNILACGDVAGPYQFTHMAAHQAWYASINSLFSGFRKFRVDYSLVPWATFTDPEVARAGLNEIQATEKGIAYDISKYDINELDRAIVDRENKGFVKVLTQKDKDKILGVCIVGYHASDLIAEFILAMKHGLGLKSILGTIHIYPTLAESNKFVAGEWRKNHAPEWIYPWLEKFHRWRRNAQDK
ncbi:MAG: pyridine nucleotide-disulfide oxidoreductase [Gammaproteobacteria bacterium]|nr:pyridine nucleotide-disulfide oxidoreductase [Gammaproteobacteria bacterium]|tara:strand:+ start:65720 stop:67867 length:2148 start_codon:yes stop_codon:yes gene_type:complete